MLLCGGAPNMELAEPPERGRTRKPKRELARGAQVSVNDGVACFGRAGEAHGGARHHGLACDGGPRAPARRTATF